MFKSLDKELKQLLFGIIILTSISITFLSSYINVIAQEGNIIKLSAISDNFKALFINNQTLTNGTETAIDSLQKELKSLSIKALENLPRGSTLITNLGNIDVQMYQLEQIGKIMENRFMNNQTS
jgi:hypothetical protein